MYARLNLVSIYIVSLDPGFQHGGIGLEIVEARESLPLLWRHWRCGFPTWSLYQTVHSVQPTLWRLEPVSLAVMPRKVQHIENGG